MPRYYFHIRGVRQELSRDELGLDFPDMASAHRETFLAARDVGAAFEACGRYSHEFTIKVVNAADELVFRLRFSEAIGLPASPGASAIDTTHRAARSHRGEAHRCHRIRSLTPGDMPRPDLSFWHDADLGRTSGAPGVSR